MSVYDRWEEAMGSEEEEVYSNPPDDDRKVVVRQHHLGSLAMGKLGRQDE